MGVDQRFQQRYSFVRRLDQNFRGTEIPLDFDDLQRRVCGI
jgi:hypothetical protein